MIAKELVDYFVQSVNPNKIVVSEPPAVKNLWQRARLTAECILATHTVNVGLTKLKEIYAEANTAELLLTEDSLVGREIIIDKDGIFIDAMKRQLPENGNFVDTHGTVLCFKTGQGDVYLTRDGALTLTETDNDMLGRPIITTAWYSITEKFVIINFRHNSELIRLLYETQVHFERVSCVTPSPRETKAKK